MASASTRRVLFVILVGTFVVQTSLVYLDDSGYQAERLSSVAQAGRSLWRENNCQSCHQIYGFGGFLGPDLTNAIPQLAAERLQSILTEGQSPMPAFHFTPAEIEAITSFLTEMDATGTGQFRFTQTLPADEILDQVVRETGTEYPLSDSAETGYRLIQSRKCIGCHLPNLQSTKRAPNLCELIATPGRAGIIETLRIGRVSRGMPQFELNSDETNAILSFLGWMMANRTEIETRFQTISNENADAARVPWFEYNE